MNRKQTFYTAPEVEVIELSVECGFGDSIQDIGSELSGSEEPIDSFEKWDGWQD